MIFKEVFAFLSLLTLIVAQRDEDLCKVVVMGREELAEEITAQIAAAAALPNVPTKQTASMSENCATYENVTSIVKKEMDKLYDKVERLFKPIKTKLALLEQPGNFPSHPASSCKEILKLKPSSPSGYYWLRASDGTAVRMLCDMTWTCGGVTGGWMKIADLDMTNTTHQCPSSLSAHIQSGKRVCARKVDEGGCTSVNYPTQGIGYSEVCGKIIGYQYATTNGVLNSGSINDPYIDGVSLTHGDPRQHIWTFISALHEGNDRTHSTCYCANRNHRGPTPPSFVGQDYFCDTGNRHYTEQMQFYDSPLWDGAGCGPTNDCCTFHNPPWFYKSLTQGTRDNIEMRVCRDELPTNEDVYIEKADIYVR